MKKILAILTFGVLFIYILRMNVTASENKIVRVRNLQITNPGVVYIPGEKVKIDLSFSDAIQVDNYTLLKLTLELGLNKDRQATCKGVSGNTIRFEYTIQDGDDALSIKHRRDALKLNGAVITAVDGTVNGATPAWYEPGAIVSREIRDGVKIIKVDDAQVTTSEIEGENQTPVLILGNLKRGEKVTIRVNDEELSDQVMPHPTVETSLPRVEWAIPFTEEFLLGDNEITGAVTTVDGKTFAIEPFTYTYIDVNAPEIVSVVISDYPNEEEFIEGEKATITVTFNEKIKGGTPKISFGGVLTLAKTTMVKVSDTVYQYEYTIPNTVKGEVKVTITGAEDLAGNVMEDAEEIKTFKVAPLEIDIYLTWEEATVGEQQIYVEFNRPMSEEVVISVKQQGSALTDAVNFNNTLPDFAYKTDNKDQYFRICRICSDGYQGNEDGDATVSVLLNGVKAAEKSFLVTTGTLPTIPTGYYYKGGNMSEGYIISDIENDQEDKGNQFVWIPANGYKNGGFWIGRYEASGTGAYNDTTGAYAGDAQSKKGYMPWVGITPNSARQKTSNFIPGNNPEVYSRSVTDEEWVLIFKYIAQEKNLTKFKNASFLREVGNYQDSVIPGTSTAAPGRGERQVSGFHDYWQLMNIYDLVGNVNEQMYSGSTDYVLTRGGHFKQSAAGFPPLAGTSPSATTSADWRGFRIAMFYKESVQMTPSLGGELFERSGVGSNTVAEGYVVTDEPSGLAGGNEFVWAPSEGSPNGGFFVGRFEASAEGEGHKKTATSKHGVDVAVNVSYYDASMVSFKYAKESDLFTSRLLTEKNWQDILELMAGKDGDNKWYNDVNVRGSERYTVWQDGTTWGNYTNSVAPANILGVGVEQVTGYSGLEGRGDVWSKKHIHDLAGNMFEWIHSTRTDFSADGMALKGGVVAIELEDASYASSSRSVTATAKIPLIGFRYGLFYKPERSTDVTKPTVSKIELSKSIEELGYTKGEEITILVTFSEPLKNGTPRISFDGDVVLSKTDMVKTATNQYKFTYTVPNYDGGTVEINITDAEDQAGNVMNDANAIKTFEMLPLETDIYFTWDEATVGEQQIFVEFNQAVLDEVVISTKQQGSVLEEAINFNYISSLGYTSKEDNNYQYFRNYRIRSDGYQGNEDGEAKVKVVVDGKVVAEKSFMVITGILPPIPTGYYYREGSMSEGYVISDIEDDKNNEGNQFVWVPANGYKNGGFWIGRYEASGTGAYNSGTGTYAGDAQSKKGYMPWTKISPNSAIQKADAFITNGEVYSRLVTMQEWYLIYKYIAQEKTLNWFNSSLSKTIGNYKDSVIPGTSTPVPGRGVKQVAGFSDYWKQMNIYDLTGSVNEITYFGHQQYITIYGGNYQENAADFSPLGFNNLLATSAQDWTGFRLAMFYKEEATAPPYLAGVDLRERQEITSNTPTGGYVVTDEPSGLAGGNEFVWIPNEGYLNGGFFVGRFEASTDGAGRNIVAESKQGANLVTDINYFGSAMLSFKVLKDEDLFTSRLLTEKNWQDVLEFIAGRRANNTWYTDVTATTSERYKVWQNGTTWGNYIGNEVPANIAGSGEMQVAGYSGLEGRGDVWSKKHIHDLAGNGSEWLHFPASNYVNGPSYIAGYYFSGSSESGKKATATAAVPAKTGITNYLTFRYALFYKPRAVIDTTKPIVTKVELSKPAIGPEYAAGEEITILVTFSEPLKNDTPKISLDGPISTVKTDMVKTATNQYKYTFPLPNSSGGMVNVSITDASDFSGNIMLDAENVISFSVIS